LLFPPEETITSTIDAKAFSIFFIGIFLWPSKLVNLAVSARGDDHQHYRRQGIFDLLHRNLPLTVESSES
jgi:hypothetical protein